jgi:hypothetical protein
MLLLSSPISTTFKQTIHNVSSSHFSFQPHNLPFNRQTLPTSYSCQTPYMVSSQRGPIHLLRSRPIWSPPVLF